MSNPHTNSTDPAAPAPATTDSSLRPEAKACCDQAELLARQGRVAEAEQAYQAGLKLNPDALELQLGFARFKATHGRPVEALKGLNELLKAWAHRTEVWRLGGEICLSHPQFNEVALDWTAEAVRLHPGDAVLAEQRQLALARTTKPLAGPPPAPAPAAATPKPKAAGKLSFVLGATRHGPMIFSRLDACYVQLEQRTVGFGVGHQLMESGGYDPVEVDLLKRLLLLRREYYHDGVVALDCGANIGVHTVEWGRLMQGWGSVISFEAQEKIYYALAGNVILNNLMNVKAIHAALSDKEGFMDIPQPDYMANASFGSLELRQRAKTENIGQPIDYSSKLLTVRTATIDSLNLARVDLIKMDVEGMEDVVLNGARETLARCKPIACIEIIKSNPQQIASFFTSLGYRVFPADLNCLAVHESDPCLKRVGASGK